MVKKLKAMAEGKDDNQLASAIKDSAQQIWLAGLGAFSKAQEEGGKVFEALVKEGTGIQRRTRSYTEDRIGDVTGRVSKVTGEIARQATESWDKLEQVFEDRVARALGRLGVPTSQEIKTLMGRVDALNASVQSLGGKAARGAKKATAAAKTTRVPRKAKAEAAPAKAAARKRTRKAA